MIKEDRQYTQVFFFFAKKHVFLISRRVFTSFILFHTTVMALSHISTYTVTTLLDVITEKGHDIQKEPKLNLGD